MSKYHVNLQGNPGLCTATKRCPFGGAEAHFATADEARESFERAMALDVISGPIQRSRSSAQTVLETIHGSHLYGLSRPDSDVDTYRVLMNDGAADPRSHTRLKTKQRIKDGDDVLETNLTSFLLKAEEGVPQALEAMFSRLAPPGPLDSFRYSYFLHTANFAVTYKRTVMNFARLGVEEERAFELLAPTDTEEITKKRVKESLRQGKKPRRVERNGLQKYRRHSLRLMLNRETGIEFGRFNPTLSDKEKEFVLRGAELEDLKFATLIRSRVPQ